ncbi:MAG: hypothetical protein ABR990_05875 [Terracidiphilus sp.]|jgi:hypothetical protein
MKRTIGILGIALLLSCGSARVFAQADTSAPKASEPKIETAPTTYRLTYTLTEMDGGKRIGTQHFALTVNPDKDGRIILGSKVPIATESSNPESLAPSKVNYQDIGLKIFIHLKESATGVLAESDVEQTGISEEQSTVGRGNPVIRRTDLHSTALLTPGKPVMLGSLDVPGSTRHLDIEVVIEVVR